MNDSYIYVITALMPLSSLMLIVQTNPYHALVIQGIQGAVATLVFAVLGAADVALTQALMGTLLAITLYAIAVRSSLVMRLGVLEDGTSETNDESPLEQLMNDLRTIFHKHYMRVEVVPYTNTQALHRALMDKEVHTICSRQSRLEQNGPNYLLDKDEKQPYHTETRVQRLYEIMRSELSSPATSLSYVKASDSGEK